MLFVIFLMTIGTVYVYFRLRTSTFRRVRKLLVERVQVKTKQLTEKNIELEKLSLVASKTDNAVIIIDQNGIIEWVNDAFIRITGKKEQVIGKNISEIQIYQNVEDLLKEIKNEKQYKNFDSNFSDSEGKSVWINSTVTPIFDDKQMLKKFLFVDTNVTESKKMESQILTSLKEKDILLKEIHHRVKNNLQIIISLLNLQSGYIKDEHTLKTVKDGQNRVRAMALVHEKFYQSDEIGTIDFKEYAEKVCYYLRQSYLGAESKVNINIQSDQVALDMDTAMPCGLLITEIVSNSMKYAFPQNRAGEIFIRIRKEEENKIVIQISDNGVGMPTEVSIDKSESMGLQLINALTNQLDGNLEVQRDRGTQFSITFTYPKTGN